MTEGEKIPGHPSPREARQALEKKYQRAWKAFAQADASHVTKKLAADWIKASERYFGMITREEMPRQLFLGKPSPTFAVNHSLWKEASVALEGLRNNQSRAVVDFLRKRSAAWRQTTDSKSEDLGRGVIKGPNWLSDMSADKRNIEIWRRIEENCETAARLFESKLPAQLVA